ncbi:MAG: HAD-IA family hydrolase [Balneolaceae bacterium]|jgi:HAD superfamily hydrolase (TIGR01549 family)
MVQAIIWDYDGTLVDTRRKNLEVTKEIMREVTGNSIEVYEALQSLDQYQAANEDSANWRALYKTYFRLSGAQIDEAGTLWKEYQARNETEVSLFHNIRLVLKNLSDFRHGIVSQNAKGNIASYLAKQDLSLYFSTLIGYEEIDYDQQKPDPTGLLRCIQKLTNFEEGSVVYIGDHETDSQCAYLANQKLKKSGRGPRVFSIAALYGVTTDTENWKYKPNFEAHDPKDISLIVSQLENTKD